MARNDAIVITWTSLCATCDSSCAMTPSSSSVFSLFIRPVVTHSTDLSALRPVAKAFGMGLWAMATRGLGMSASAHTRSTMPCSSGCLLRGHLHRARRAERDLVGVEQRPDREPAAEDQREQHDHGVGRVGRRPDADDRGDERDENQPEQEHRRGHPRRQPPVRRIPGTRHVAPPPFGPGRVLASGCHQHYLAEMYPTDAEPLLNAVRKSASGSGFDIAASGVPACEAPRVAVQPVMRPSSESILRTSSMLESSFGRIRSDASRLSGGSGEPCA